MPEPAREQAPAPVPAAVEPAPALPPTLSSAAVVLALQRSAGNTAVARTLARDPAQPFQLTPPSLLGGPQQRPGFSLGDFRLRPPNAMHPRELQLRLLENELRPENLRTLLRLVPLPTGPPPAPDPLATPPAPTPGPTADRPPGRLDVSPTRPGEGGDVLDALAAVPEIERLSAAAREQLWGRLPTGDKWTLGVSGVVIAGGALAGVLATPSGRQTLTNLFGGRPISIPGVPWFQPEFSVQGPNYLIGLHIDVGAFLGGRGGFGRAGDGPQPLTPPGPE